MVEDAHSKHLCSVSLTVARRRSTAISLPPLASTRAYSYSAGRPKTVISASYLTSRYSTRPCPSRLLSTGPSSSTGKASATSEPPPPIRGQPIKKGKVELRPAPVKPKPSDVFPKSPSSPKEQAQKAENASATPVSAEVREAATNKGETKPLPHREGVIESARHDFESASSHGILAPPPPGAGKIKTLVHQAKEFFVRPLSLMPTLVLTKALDRNSIGMVSSSLTRIEYVQARCARESPQVDHR